MSDAPWSGRVVAITGAGRGVGRATAIEFSRLGADLFLLDWPAENGVTNYPRSSRAQLETTASLCHQQGSEAVTFEADVRSIGQLEAGAAVLSARFGGLDVLVNSAGVVRPSGVLTHDVTPADWSEVLDINLTGVYQSMRAFMPMMWEARQGSVVNVASTAGLVGYARFSAYVASKHGVIGLTKAAALDYARSGIRVNAVCPGNISDDPAVDGIMLSEVGAALGIPKDEYEDLFTQSEPSGSFVRPVAVARAITYLSSPDSDGVTGTALTVDGGYVAR